MASGEERFASRLRSSSRLALLASLPFFVHHAAPAPTSEADDVLHAVPRSSLGEAADGRGGRETVIVFVHGHRRQIGMRVRLRPREALPAAGVE